MKKIIINLGLPKTGSTNLQTNIYPNLKNVEYIGRKFDEENNLLFDKLDDLVEGRKSLIKNQFDKNLFKNEFLNFINNTDKDILISQEYWSIPFTHSLIKDKYFINNHWKKIERLDNFLKDLKCEIIYFIVHREPIEAIPSFFFTFHHMIIGIFGWNFKEINFFSEQLIKKDKNFINYNLLFDIYNLNKFLDFFTNILKRKLFIIDFKNLRKNKNFFLGEILKITNSKIDENLYNKFNQKVNVSAKNDKGDIIIKTHKPNKILIFFSWFLKIIKIKKFVKRIFVYFGFKNFKKESFVIETNKELLKKAIKINLEN